MRLFDEATGGPKEIEIPERMGVYVCGITPYDVSHLGHAFTFVHFDVLVRYLRYRGADVTHVQNVTDVDDDILRVARERGVDWRELGEEGIATFQQSMDAIGVRRPTRSPRATDFVPEIIEEVRGLEAAGATYEHEGWVYFRIKADPEYGSLSRLQREEMLRLAAERGANVDDPAKDDPLDFVLWQRSAPGEPSWESPWGPGRPGWHIECSTMARRLLGQPVEIHGGGVDLVFPHHESERAQAETIGDPPFVKHWMHSGNVSYQGEKMSKSLGNFVTVDALLERYPAIEVRRFLLSHHYRESWEFRESELAAPRVELGLQNPREVFFMALDNDLDVPAAMAALDAAGDDPELVEVGRLILALDL